MLAPARGLILLLLCLLLFHSIGVGTEFTSCTLVAVLPMVEEAVRYRDCRPINWGPVAGCICAAALCNLDLLRSPVSYYHTQSLKYKPSEVQGLQPDLACFMGPGYLCGRLAQRG